MNFLKKMITMAALGIMMLVSTEVRATDLALDIILGNTPVLQQYDQKTFGDTMSSAEMLAEQKEAARFGMTVEQVKLNKEAAKQVSEEWTKQSLEEIRSGKSAENFFGFSTLSSPIAKKTPFFALLEMYIGSGYGCWFCSIFNGIFNAANGIVTQIASKLSSTFLMLLGIGVLYFIAIKVLRLFLQFEGVDVMQFLNGLFASLGRAMIAAAILLFPLEIFRYTVSPVFQTALEVGTSIVQTAGTDNLQIIKAYRDQKGVPQLTTVSSQTMMAEVRAANNLTKDKAFEGSLRESILLNMKTISSSLIVGMASGAYLTYGAYKVTLAPDAGSKGFLPTLELFFIGVILFFAYFCIFIKYPLTLFNAFFQMAAVCALMPLWVVLWVFPVSAGYVKNALTVFLNTIFTFLGLSVVITIVLKIMDSSIPNAAPFFQALMNDEMGKAQDAFAFSGSGLLLTFVLGMICLKIIGTVPALAADFAGGINDVGLGEGVARAIFLSKELGVAGGETTARVGYRTGRWAWRRRRAVAQGVKAGVAGVAAGVGAARRRFFADSPEPTEAQAMALLRQKAFSELKNGQASVRDEATQKQEKLTVSADGFIFTGTNANGQMTRERFDFDGKRETETFLRQLPDGRRESVVTYGSSEVENKRYSQANGDYEQHNADGSIEVKQGDTLKRFASQEAFESGEVFYERQTQTQGNSRQIRILENGQKRMINESWARDENGNIFEIHRQTKTGENLQNSVEETVRLSGHRFIRKKSDEKGWKQYLYSAGDRGVSITDDEVKHFGGKNR